MVVSVGTLTFRLGEAVEIDGHHANTLVALLTTRDTPSSVSAAEKIGYEMSVDQAERAEISLGPAERAELYFVLDAVNPNGTDAELAALEHALRAPLATAA